LQISNGLPNEQNIALAKFGSPKIEGGVVMNFKKNHLKSSVSVTHIIRFSYKEILTNQTSEPNE